MQVPPVSGTPTSTRVMGGTPPGGPRPTSTLTSAKATPDTAPTVGGSKGTYDAAKAKLGGGQSSSIGSPTALSARFGDTLMGKSESVVEAQTGGLSALPVSGVEFEVGRSSHGSAVSQHQALTPGHDGILGKLSDTDIQTLVDKHKSKYADLSPKNIRNIERNIHTNKGEFISTKGKGLGPGWAEAIAADIIQRHKQQVTVEKASPTDGVSGVGDLGSSAGTGTVSVAPQKLTDAEVKQEVTKVLTQLMGLKEGDYSVVSVDIVGDGSLLKNCHEFTFNDGDGYNATPPYGPVSLLQRAAPTDTIAVCFTGSEVSHTAKLAADGSYIQRAQGSAEIVVDPSSGKSQTIFANIVYKTSEQALRDSSSAVLIQHPGTLISDEQWAAAAAKR